MMRKSTIVALENTFFFYISQLVKPESVLGFLELLRAIESLLFPRENKLKC